MARCLKCIHKNVCNSFRIELEHLNGDCADYLSDDVAPKTEVAREIFEEIEKAFIKYYEKRVTYSDPTLLYHIREAVGFSLNEMFTEIAELKKKYIENLIKR